MKRATKNLKPLVVDILTQSFEDNASVNYVIKHSEKRIERVQALMNYSFEVCLMSGDIFLSDDNKACALIMYPDKKKFNLKSTFLNLQLIFRSVGFGNISKTVKREKLISSIQPKIQLSHLWFIGVGSDEQNKGIGSRLLQEIIKHSDNNHRPIYLETSTTKNLPWYKKFGFEIYNEQELTYHLYFLKRNANS